MPNEQLFFSLRPFREDSSLLGVEINGNIARKSDTLFVRYALVGDLTKIIIPKKKNMPSRRYSLWKNTCFELFMATTGLPQYWEFNISPSGDWNVFRFQNYRNEGYGEKLQEDLSFSSLPFISEKNPEMLIIQLECDLDFVTFKNQKFDIGISAVINFRDRGLSYWALRHCNDEPNFHLRDSFTLSL